MKRVQLDILVIIVQIDKLKKEIEDHLKCNSISIYLLFSETQFVDNINANT